MYLRHRQVEKEAVKSLPAPEPGESVREAMDKVTLRWALMDALAQLSEEERQAVTLVKVEGLTHKEAAVVLDEAEGTVRWRVFEALNKMRRLLESEEECVESTMPSS